MSNYCTTSMFLKISRAVDVIQGCVIWRKIDSVLP